MAERRPDRQIERKDRVWWIRMRLFDKEREMSEKNGEKEERMGHIQM